LDSVDALLIFCVLDVHADADVAGRPETSSEPGQIHDPNVRTNPSPQVSNLSGQIHDLLQNGCRHTVKNHAVGALANSRLR